MKFSLSYMSQYKKLADEIKCPFTQLGLISKFAEDNQDKRYVVMVNDLQDNYDKLIKQLELFNQITPNYTVECLKIVDFMVLRDQKINSYLKYPVSDWETFNDLASLGVSDIYIDGPLGFQKDNMISYLKKKQLVIRVSPSVSPNASFLGLRPNSFFIRPDDLNAYEDVIGMIDFCAKEQEVEDALFKTYKRESFNFDLNALLDDAKFHVLNPLIKSDFVNPRLNCGQRCKIPGNSCHICQNTIFLTNSLHRFFQEDRKQNEANKDIQVQQS